MMANFRFDFYLVFHTKIFPSFNLEKNISFFFVENVIQRGNGQSSRQT